MRRELRRLSALFLLIVLSAAGCSTGDEESRPPQLGVKADDEQAAEKLGFPSTATRNTVRVGGSDAAADAAGVASALYPATGDADRPTASTSCAADVTTSSRRSRHAAATASSTCGKLGRPCRGSGG